MTTQLKKRNNELLFIILLWNNWLQKAESLFLIAQGWKRQKKISDSSAIDYIIVKKRPK